MRRAVLLALLILAPGCLGLGAEPLPDLTAKYLQGRFGEAAWSGHPVTFLQKGAALAKPALAPYAGMSFAVEPVDGSTRLEVRVHEGHELEGKDLRVWRHGGETQSGDPGLPLSIALEGPGPFAVDAALYEGAREWAHWPTPLHATVDPRWIVQSRVFPVNPGGRLLPSEIPGYDSMSDQIRFAVPEGVKWLSVRTELLASSDPVAGRDVDLQLRGPDGASVRCGVEGDAGPAFETAAVTGPVPGTWTAVVGALRGSDGADCAPAYSYDNAGPVSYQVLIELRFEEAPRTPRLDVFDTPRLVMSV